MCIDNQVREKESTWGRIPTVMPMRGKPGWGEHSTCPWVMSYLLHTNDTSHLFRKRLAWFPTPGIRWGQNQHAELTAHRPELVMSWPITGEWSQEKTSWPLAPGIIHQAMSSQQENLGFVSETPLLVLSLSPGSKQVFSRCLVNE